jgi:hypothetical protein
MSTTHKQKANVEGRAPQCNQAVLKTVQTSETVACFKDQEDEVQQNKNTPERTIFHPFGIRITFYPLFDFFD